MEFLAFRADQHHRLIIETTGDTIETERMRTGYLNEIDREDQPICIIIKIIHLSRICIIAPAENTRHQSGTDHRSLVPRNGENLENSVRRGKFRLSLAGERKCSPDLATRTSHLVQPSPTFAPIRRDQSCIECIVHERERERGGRGSVVHSSEENNRSSLG